MEQQLQPELRVFILPKAVINPSQPGPTPNVIRANAITLLGTFVPKLIEFGIGALGALLKKAGADKTLQATGRAFTDFYAADVNQTLQVNSEIGAVLAIWGIFSDEDGKTTHPDDAALKRLESLGFVVPNADIDIIFEGEIRPTADETAFFVEARHFSVRESISGKRSDSRAYVVTCALATPSTTADGDSIAVGNIHFGKLTPGEYVQAQRPPDDAGNQRLRSNLMPWKQITAESQAAYQRDVSANRARNERYMPVMLTVTITETEDGNKFLAALGELLEGAKSDAAKELSNLILPESREKARADRAEADEKLYADELDAEIEVRKAQKELAAATPEEKPIKQAELVKAQRLLERRKLLRKAAGLPDRPPIP